MLNKAFISLLGLALGGGGLALAGSSANDWVYDTAAENFPFLKDFEGTAFGKFAKDNWAVVGGGLAAYSMAPNFLKPLVGLVTAGFMAFKAVQSFLPGMFGGKAAPDQSPELQADATADATADVTAELSPAGLTAAQRAAIIEKHSGRTFVVEKARDGIERMAYQDGAVTQGRDGLKEIMATEADFDGLEADNVNDPILEIA